MHINYRYLLYKAQQLSPQPNAAILDYGCGAGEVVEEGRKIGLCIYGAEIFYNEHVRNAAAQKGLLGDIIREISNGTLPFPDNFFDLVLSNQVFEHVRNLDEILMEIYRVLKLDGFLLSLFPSKEVIREKHCGIPFLHWFSRHSRIRFYYAFMLRTLGLGYHKGEKSASQWTRDFLNWLDEFTYYRERKTIFRNFRKYFRVSFIESDYISFRLKANANTKIFAKFIDWPIVNPIGCEVFRRLGGLVILSQKCNENSPECEHIVVSL